jgi:glycosyltransferase involved in cell wall biosynthesis
MNVLSIGTDRKIFEEGSAVRQRMIEYGTLFDELHIIVFAKKSLGLTDQKIADNVWVYPTNSRNKIAYIIEAIKIGRKVMISRDFTSDDFVSAQDPFETGIAAYRIARIGGLQLQLQIHTDFLSPYFSQHSFLNKIRVVIARWLLPKADRIRVVSRRIAQSLESLNLQTKPMVLPILLNTKHVIGAKKQGIYMQFDIRILMASRFEPEKDFITALKAFKRVVNIYPKTGLIIIGQGSEQSTIESYIKNEHLENNVIVLPWQKDVAMFGASSDMFLLTSQYEGYGLALVEAALVQIPIVTTDVGIAGDILIHEKSALISPVGDSISVAENIVRLINNTQLRQDLVTQAYDAVRRNIITKKEEYLALYKKSFTG